MSVNTYRKLIATRLSSDFRSAIALQELPIPTPEAHQLVVQNKYAGVNAGFDTLLCRGDVPYVQLTPPFDLGVEAVGEVVAIGSSVHDINVGDAVVTAMRGGGYREYQVIDSTQATKVRSASSDVLTLMPTGISALVALEQVGAMQSQEVVLVTAAAGGTGHIAVQLAKQAGNHVIGTCGSDAKAQLLRQLGCDRVIQYRSESLDQVLKQEYPSGVNLVFDCVGGKTFDICVDNLAIRGRLVVVGFISEYASAPSVIAQPRLYHTLFWKAASVRGFLMPHFAEYAAEARDRLLERFYAGTLKVAVDPAPFHGIEAIPDAVDYLLSGQNCGKVVVKY